MMILLSGSAIFAQKAEVNTQESSIEWIGKKLGSQHNGNILMKTGYLELKDDAIVGGHFIVDMASITNNDLQGDSKQRLEGHLKSDDFFGVETYPTAEFVVTKSSKFTDGIATLTGDLTIKGKTESISFEVERTGNNFAATLEIDRSKFDVRFGSNSFFDNLGDKAIKDIFTLNIKLVTI
jgi:polyisoprenoid-binding protein YceI